MKLSHRVYLACESCEVSLPVVCADPQRTEIHSRGSGTDLQMLHKISSYKQAMFHSFRYCSRPCILQVHGQASFADQASWASWKLKPQSIEWPELASSQKRFDILNASELPQRRKHDTSDMNHSERRALNVVAFELLECIQ